MSRETTPKTSDAVGTGPTWQTWEKQAFALLWDAEAGEALLFRRPARVICADTLTSALPALRAAHTDGLWLAGGVPYEAGLPATARLARHHPSGGVWFGGFVRPEHLSPDALQVHLDRWKGEPLFPEQSAPDMDEPTYLDTVARVRALIRAGDIYQANIGFRVKVRDADGRTPDPRRLFAHLFSPETAPHGGLLHDGQGQWWISLSPELFFRIDGGTVTARPMKGTTARAPGEEADRTSADMLRHDTKNRAENLMITDLLRNDLARIAVAGSVRVPRLFAIETYPTVHQMTSTVTATLHDGLNGIDALQTLFPCGSITGAPKIRAVEVISGLEEKPRGIWCGAFGWIAPDSRESHFSVAIRTIAAKDGDATLAVGSGIVADSDPHAERAECLAKTAFLGARPAYLIETMRATRAGVLRFERHLARLSRSAGALQFSFDRNLIAGSVSSALQQIAEGHAMRLRLTLARDGTPGLTLAPLPPRPDAPVRVAFRTLPLPSDNWRLRHKTDCRAFHDTARADSGCFEILWLRRDGLATEGSFTSIFVRDGDRYLTPPARLGLLPGVLRAELLESGAAEERVLDRGAIRRASDEGRLYIGNALRGLLAARLAD